MFHVEHSDEQAARAVLTDSLAVLSIKISEAATSRLLRYFTLLLQKNEHVNLISPRQDLQTKIIIHLTDSLTPLIWPGLPKRATAMDFGSGGGLPAIPLAIVRPEWRYALVEATGKKTTFLGEAREILNLENISISNKFLESAKNPENILYDLITARGVSDLKKLFAIAAPRLNRGGFFIAFKGPQGEQELRDAADEMEKRKLILHASLNFKLPLVDAERRLFIFQKS